MKKNLFLLNYAPHYRLNLFQVIERELEVDFIFSNESLPIKKLDLAEIKSYRGQVQVKKIGPFLWYKGSIKASISYRNVVLTGNPFILSNWLILLGRQIMRKRTFLWTHGLYGKERPLRRWIKLLYFKLSSGLFLYNNYGREILKNNYFKIEKLHVIYNSIHFDSHRKVLNTLKKSSLYTNYFKNDSPVLIYVGRIQKSKRLDLVVNALLDLKKEGLLLNFVIVGEMIDDPEILNLINSPDIKDQIWLYGACYDEKLLGELFFNSTVCISPGNVGLTAIHSLAYGTPIITHNNFVNQGPEFESIINGETGMFFDENNYESLLKTLRSFFKSSMYFNKSITQSKCIQMIEEYYNPYVQVRIIKEVLNGVN